jgi:uncharacterized membrane protein YedE/YeeE
MLLLDKTFGCSSILAQTMLHPTNAIEGLQAPAFAGMLLASYLYSTQGKSLLPLSSAVLRSSSDSLTNAIGQKALAGLLVGFGTRLANGCTSGHMLTGLAQLSLRSLVATCCFFGCAVVTVAFFGTAPAASTGSLRQSFFTAASVDSQTTARLLSVTTTFYIATAIFLHKARKQRDAGTPASTSQRMLVALFAGATFASGLLMSGMYLPSKTLGFLNIWRAWKGVPGADFDPSLLMIVLGGLLPNLIATQLYTKHQKPLLSAQGTQASVPVRTTTTEGVTPRLIIGSLLFGAGWGMSGICPGPAIVNLVSSWPFSTDFVAFFTSLVAGAKLAEHI